MIFSVTFYGTLCGGGLKVLAWCKSGVEPRQEIIWYYYVLDIAQTKVHTFKQGEFILDKYEFMVGHSRNWSLLSSSPALS